jgi:hypothetical protein
MPGPLDEEDVPIGRERRVGGPDAGRQVLHDLALDVGLGEAPWDVDRAHLLERLLQVEDLPDEDRVLVGRDAVLDERPLADRLEEPAREAAPPEPVHDPQADRGLAPVLACRRQVDVPHPAIFGRSERRGDAPASHRREDRASSGAPLRRGSSCAR